MDFLKSGLKTVLGSQDPSQQPSGAEIIDRLVERIQSSTLLDDRRDACRAIKALSRKYRVDVGAQGMEALISVLNADKQDCEIVSYTLDTLCNIMSSEVFEEEECAEGNQDALLHIGEQFTEMFIKHPENVSIILSFLEEYDFKVRWPALKLLTTMLTNRSRDIQEIILISPMGVSRLMDLLGDTREIIRNDVLLLLIQLTKANANLQKIVAFENAFDKIFDVIYEEGCSDGGIVVEDCLLLMLNLLKNNTSNQNFFKEGSYITKLGPMFHLFSESTEELVWPEQKVANLVRTLQVIRCLVSPSNPGQVSQSCQEILFTSGIFQALCNVLMLYGVPARFLTEVITTLAEVIRGNMQNQQHFSTVMAPSVPPREIIVVLLTSMVNEKNNIELRCSCLYCFECYLFKNETIQAEIIQTLLPSSVDAKLTCGQLICTGMFSHDCLSNWLSAVALSYALIENPVQKENLLRALLVPDINSSPVSLIAQIVVLLQQCNKVQGKLGFLILLSSWLAHCQLAVKHFLEIPTAVPYLTTQACSMDRDDSEELVQGLSAFLLGLCILFNDGSVTAYTKDALVHLVANRVGEEVFLAKLSEVSRSEQYSRASKSPQLIINRLEDLMLDYEFCKLFKAFESMVIKAVTHKSVEVNGEEDVTEYKEMIREQDRKIIELQRQKAELETILKQTCENLSRLTDENTLLRAQINAGLGLDNDGELNQQIDTLKTECSTKDSVIKDLELKLENLSLNLNSTSKENELQQQINRLIQDHEDLLILFADKDEKLAKMQNTLQSLGIKVDDNDEVKPEAETSIVV